ncbi:hypothetical protein U1Q18_000998 [Sarracenia purpurea var. burkii]
MRKQKAAAISTLLRIRVWVFGVAEFIRRLASRRWQAGVAGGTCTAQGRDGAGGAVEQSGGAEARRPVRRALAEALCAVVAEAEAALPRWREAADLRRKRRSGSS